MIINYVSNIYLSCADLQPEDLCNYVVFFNTILHILGWLTSLVDDYNKVRAREPRDFGATQQDILRRTDHWKTTKWFFITEVNPIMDGKIKVTDARQGKPLLHDILFEYLVIRAVTSLEMQLKHYCNIFVKTVPEKAETLLKNRDTTKDLSLQILSTYSFSSLRDIHHVFSTLLGKDYFQVLRHRSEENKSSIGYELEHLYRASPLFKKWDMFVLLIQLRNKFVHENKHITIRSKKVKKDLLNTIYEVNYITSFEEEFLPYDADSFSKIRPVY